MLWLSIWNFHNVRFRVSYCCRIHHSKFIFFRRSFIEKLFSVRNFSQSIEFNMNLWWKDSFWLLSRTKFLLKSEKEVTLLKLYRLIELKLVPVATFLRPYDSEFITNLKKVVDNSFPDMSITDPVSKMKLTLKGFVRMETYAQGSFWNSCQNQEQIWV